MDTKKLEALAAAVEHGSFTRAAEALGVYYNTGEGGLHEDLYRYGPNTITQVASGRFGVEEKYLNTGAAIEIKMGQGAKPGIGGHLPGLVQPQSDTTPALVLKGVQPHFGGVLRHVQAAFVALGGKAVAGACGAEPDVPCLSHRVLPPRS